MRSDMEVEWAINVVARQVIHNAADEFGNGVEWGDYPEIGQNDWLAIVAEVERLTPAPDVAEFPAAYALLEARADDE